MIKDLSVLMSLKRSKSMFRKNFTLKRSGMEDWQINGSLMLLLLRFYLQIGPQEEQERMQRGKEKYVQLGKETTTTRRSNKIKEGK